MRPKLLLFLTSWLGPGALAGFAAMAGCAQFRAARFEEHFEDGGVKREGLLAGGKQVGEWTFYYPGGGKKAQGRFEDDFQDGPWTYWYENGAKEMEGAFVNERRDGLWRYWHAGGALRAEGRFHEDRETGFWTFHGPDGQCLRAGHFEDGKLAGRWSYWDEAGKPKAEGCYLEGRRAGPWSFWDEEGRVSRQDFPLPEGWRLVRERSAEGVLRREGFLHDGKPAGRWVSWHRSGRMRLLGDLRDGEPEGIWEAFDAEGKRFALGRVARGRLVGGWTVRTDSGEAPLRPEGLRLPALMRGDWSDDALPEERSPEAVLSVWLAEAVAPIDEAALGAAFASVPLEGEAFDELAFDEPGAPATGAQAALTVFQEENLARIVKGYQQGGIEYRRPTNLPAFSLHAGGPDYMERDAGEPPRGDEELSRDFLGKGLPFTWLRGAGGEPIDLTAFAGKKNVLLVILRGFDGRVCEYCAGQTMALGRSRQDFEERDTEVMVVYPGRQSRLETFLEAYREQFGARPPRFRFLYDSELRFADALGIGPPEGKIARPTVLLLDRSGSVRFAHVGTRKEDRPTVEQLLAEIDRLAGRGAGAGRRVSG
jgi:antitoxin component YwqK of YwqJK toxin-antitoxin module/peroxiredoxin